MKIITELEALLREQPESFMRVGDRCGDFLVTEALNLGNNKKFITVMDIDSKARFGWEVEIKVPYLKDPPSLQRERSKK